MLVWALVSVPLTLMVLGVAVVAAAAVDSVLDVAHAPYISLAVGLWPPLAAAVALLVARLVGLAVVRPRLPPAALLAVAGGVATALAQFGIMAWTEARYGYFDPDFVGSAAALPLPMTVLTASAAAWLVTVRPARTIAAGGSAVSLTILGWLAASSLEGAFDGLSEESWLLGVTYAAGSSFVGVVLLTLWNYRRSG